MNIKDLPKDSYRPVQATSTPKLNIRDLPQGSYKPITPVEEPGVVRSFAKAVIDPLSKIGGSVAKTLLPKAAEGSLRDGSVPSVLGGNVDLVGYRGGRELQGKEFAKDVAGTVLEGASYVPMGGIAVQGAKLVGKAYKAGKVTKAVIPKIAGLVAEGATAGGFVGAGSALQRNEDAGTVLKEGAIGTAVGGIAGPIAGHYAPQILGKATKNIPEYFSKEASTARVFEKRQKDIFDIESNYIKTKNKNAYKQDARNESRKRVAETDVLVNAVDQDGKINTKGTGGAIEQYKKLTIDGREGVVKDLLEKEGKFINLSTIKKYAEDVINKENKLQGSSLESAYSRLNSVLAGLSRKADENGNLPLAVLHDTKISETANIDYSKPSSKIEAKTVARSLKELIENESGQDVKMINEELAKYYDDIELLSDLDGKRVKGGRLGKYFAQGSGNIIGGLTGHAVGGPVGAAIGAAVGGEASAKIAGQQMSRVFGKAVGKVPEKSKILQQAEDKVKTLPLSLPAPKFGRDYIPTQSNNLGSRNAQYKNINTAKATNIPNSIAPKLSPAEQKLEDEAMSNMQYFFEQTDAPQFIQYYDDVLQDTVTYKTSTSMKDFPAHLRKRSLLNSVRPYFERQERPTKGTQMMELYDELMKEKDTIKKKIQQSEERNRFADPTGQAFAGAPAGITEDDEGNMTFDPTMAALGIAGIGAIQSKNLTKKILPGYKEKGDLTTKILKSLEGKSTVSKQFILDATNRGELKQIERDLVRRLAETEGNTVDVAKFANKVKAELLPLERKAVGEGKNLSKYESISLPDDLRGNVKNYTENIYASPIKTSAGNVHFGGSKAGENYFGHTRIEDMADNSTRRVIEVQSDLYQKGNLERELTNDSFDYTDKKTGITPKYSDRMAMRAKETAKLAQYNDPTAHFRMIREEIKKAAEDGKTKLQFPTGETAMKIEGLGTREDAWAYLNPDENANETWLYLKPETLEVGKEVADSSFGNWIITDVLGDGKFKAIPQREIKFTIQNDYELNRLAKEYGYLDGGEIDANAVAKDGGLFPKVIEKSNNLEQFDISGKVDTNNPIYKFYNKEVRNYLNKFGGREVVDNKGVSWIEIPINKEQGKMPVEAFGLIGAVGLGAAATGGRGASAESNFDWETKTTNKSGLFKNKAKFERKDITHPENVKKFEELYKKNVPKEVQDILEAVAYNESKSGALRVNEKDQKDGSDSVGLLHMGQKALDEFNKRKESFGYTGPDLNIKDLKEKEADIIQKYVQGMRILRDMKVNGRSLHNATTFIQNPGEKNYGKKVIKKYENKL